MRNLSSKELGYISDVMSWEMLSAKKSFQYAHQETNPAHQQIFFDAARMHQKNYLGMLNYISQFNSQQGGQMH